jgi:transcriptional regulator with XRE-family HTH domain
MTTSYADFIKYLREERGLSQAFVAERTHMSRTSYIAVEQGSKALSLAEAVALTQLFGITIDELLCTQAPDYLKYKQMILAFVRAAATEHTSIKKTKLAKLLYLADFSWYYVHNTSMSGLTYRRIDFGPVADAYFRLLEELEQSGTISIKQIYRDDYHMYEIEETRASQKTALGRLTKIELTHMSKIWQQWAKASTAEIVKFTEDQAPYQQSKPGEIIPYQLICTEESFRVY